MKTALIAALATVMACGGANKPDEADPLGAARGGEKHGTHHAREGGQMGHGGEGGETAGMPPAIEKFHAILAPRWHAEQGSQRTADTCATMAEFRAGAEAIVAAAPPGGSEAAAWSDGGKQLAEAVAALDGACKANDAAAFEAAFARVHERFHGVMAAAGGKHGHGEHGHGEHGHGEHGHGEHGRGEGGDHGHRP